MKRHIILFTSLLLLVACSSNKPNTLSEKGLKGKVKTVILYSFEAEKTSDNVQKGDIISHWDANRKLDIDPISVSEYDNNGNILSKIYYDEYQELSSRQTFTYLNKNLIGQYTYDDRDRLFNSWELILEEGQPIGVKEQGNTYSECVFDGFNLLSYKFNHRRIVEQTYENNLLCQSITKNLEGKTTRSITRKWNEAGQLLYEEDAVEYDSSEIINNEYDKNGHIIKHTTQYGENTRKNYTFEYLTFDDKGNWTERVIYSNDTPHIIQERIIEYY